MCISPTVYGCSGRGNVSVHIDFVSISTLVNIVVALNMPTFGHRKISIKVIASLCVYMYHDDKSQNLKGFKEMCVILSIVVQSIENVGRVVWLPRKWFEIQRSTNINVYWLFLTCLRQLMLILVIVSWQIRRRAVDGCCKKYVKSCLSDCLLCHGQRKWSILNILLTEVEGDWGWQTRFVFYLW